MSRRRAPVSHTALLMPCMAGSACRTVDEALAAIVTKRRRWACDIDLQQCFYSFCKLLKMLFKRRRQRVEPMDGTKEIFHGPCWYDLFDPQRDTRNAFAYSSLNLAMDLPCAEKISTITRHWSI